MSAQTPNALSLLTQDVPIVYASSALQALETGVLPSSTARLVVPLSMRFVAELARPSVAGMTSSVDASSVRTIRVTDGLMTDDPPLRSMGMASSSRTSPPTSPTATVHWDASTREGLVAMESWVNRVPHMSHRPRLLRLVRSLHMQLRTRRGESQMVIGDGRLEQAAIAVRSAMLNPRARYRDVLEAGLEAMDAMSEEGERARRVRVVRPEPRRLQQDFEEEASSQEEDQELMNVRWEDDQSESTASTSSASSTASGSVSDITDLSQEESVRECIPEVDELLSMPMSTLPGCHNIRLAPAEFARCPLSSCVVRRVEEDVALRLRGLAARVERGELTWDSQVLTPRDAMLVVRRMLVDLEAVQTAHRPWSEETRHVVMNTDFTIVNARQLPGPLRLAYHRTRDPALSREEDARYVYAPIPGRRRQLVQTEDHEWEEGREEA